MGIVFAGLLLGIPLALAIVDKMQTQGTVRAWPMAGLKADDQTARASESRQDVP
jgi:hypothetical protein